MGPKVCWQRFWGLSALAALHILKPTLGILYSAIAVDDTYETIQLYVVDSLVHCVASCEIQDGCSVVAYDKASNTCNNVKRDSVTLSNPTKTVYVPAETKSKAGLYFNACYLYNNGLYMPFFSVNCPYGFTYFFSPSDVCFEIIHETMSWPEAKARCEEYPGASLASILKATEEEFLLGIFIFFSTFRSNQTQLVMSRHT